MASVLKALVPLLLLTSPVFADQTCRFQTECIEGEACSDSAYDLTVTARDDGSWILSDVSGDHIAGAVGRNWFAPLNDGDDGAVLLTVDEDGIGRYSVHLPGAGVSVLYIGQCREE